MHACLLLARPPISPNLTPRRCTPLFNRRWSVQVLGLAPYHPEPACTATSTSFWTISNRGSRLCDHPTRAVLHTLLKVPLKARGGFVNPPSKVRGFVWIAKIEGLRLRNMRLYCLYWLKVPVRAVTWSIGIWYGGWYGGWYSGWYDGWYDGWYCTVGCAGA